MYNWVKPNCVIPVHGEHRHIKEHISFAKEMQIPFALQIENGDIIQIFSQKKPAIIDKAPTGKIYLDGNIGVSSDSNSIKERKNLAMNGYLEITLIIQDEKKIKKSIVSFRGIPTDETENMILELEDEVNNTCRSFSLKNKSQEKSLKEILKQNCRRIIKEKTGKKPFTSINIARI